MHILVATDAWHPQVNGVVRSIEALAGEARLLGADISVITPEGFRNQIVVRGKEPGVVEAARSAVVEMLAGLRSDGVAV